VRTSEHALDGKPRRGLAFFPQWFGNAYIRLLYDHLSHLGFSLATNGNFTLGWLVRSRHEVDILHFNWPQRYYVSRRRPHSLVRVLSWVTLGRFAGRLIAARVLGYRVVWTIHQVYPHELVARRLHRSAGQILAQLSNALIAHDEATAQAAVSELGRAVARKIRVIPHASYLEVYPPGRARHVVRAELGIPSSTVTFLSFGSLRRYKDLDVLLEGFSLASLEEAALVIAGRADDAEVAERVWNAARLDTRIRIFGGLEYVPDERVQELFEACDVAVVPRGDGGTSGALMLALSMGKPAIAADQPAYAELIARQGCGWTFSPHDASSLAGALEVAASDRSVAREKGAAALAVAQGLRWPDLAREMGEVLAGQSWPPRSEPPGATR
jgi:beta-1,4-mannosyltransferase